MKHFLIVLIIVIFGCNSSTKKSGSETGLNETISNEQDTLPNIIIFYVDDLGYGDLSCYGATSVQTPNVDKLANNGIRFTDAHSSAATCTPSRYSLLTGQYAFRNNAAILPGDAPLLISPDTPTLPTMLKEAGFKTAVVGKWHLGLGDGNVDWNTEVKPGPLEIGFDYSFLLPATGDRVPTVYLENYNVVNLNPEDSLKIDYKKPYANEPTGTKNPELLRQEADPQHSQAIVNGISRIGYQKGGDSALWTDEDFPNVFTDKAKSFINSNKDEPFFLFFSFHDIHVPRLPNERFQGKTQMGPRGDAIVQMDWMTGEIINELEKLGLSENTLVIFTSDNGPVLNDGYEDMAEEKLGNHDPAGPFRGGKYSAFEAGTRVPMITYWPAQIKNNGTNNALISQIDYYASLANLVDEKLDTDEAKDSKNVLNALLNTMADARTIMIEESFTLSLRFNDYKYIAPVKGNNRPDWLKNKNIEGGFSKEPQLYNLSVDPGEKNNIAPSNKELVENMQAKIDSIIAIR